MFLKTIRSKILFAICVSFLLSAICVFGACLMYYVNNKIAIELASNLITEEYAIGIDNTIKKFSDLSGTLSLLGGAFYGTNNKETKKLKEAISKVFCNGDFSTNFGGDKWYECAEYDIPNTNVNNDFGGGIWYEPYVIEQNQKKFCVYADYKKDGCVFDHSCELKQYDYLSQPWYTSTKSIVTKNNAVNVFGPYKSDLGTKELVFTICTGLFDSKGKFIGIATVDWKLNNVIKKLANIKPTHNTFILFANKKQDSIVVLDYDKNNLDKNIGKSLSSVEWYNENLQNQTKIVHNKKEYICFVKHIFGDFVLCINMPTEELFYYVNGIFIIVLCSFLVSIILSIFIVFKILYKNVEKPIQYLVNKSTEYANGNFDIKFDISSSREFSILASTFNNMVSSIKEHTLNLAIANATKKSIENELKVASMIQIANLKKVFPPYPNNKEFDIFATMTPAKAVGGDFYDFFFIDDSHFVFLIADVSDKGIPAALFMMEAKGVLKNSIERISSLKEAVEMSNNMLYKSNDAGFFVTAFIAVLNIKTGLLEYVNAGHNKPLLKQSSSKYCYLNTKGCVALGVLDTVKYTSYKIQLQQDSALLLYTDGITEAQNTKKEFFGERRLMDTMNKFDFTAKGNVDNLIKTVNSFCDGAEQYDDMTILNIIYKRNDKKALVVNATVDNWSTVYDFLIQDITDKKIDKGHQSKILLACEEVFVNIANYAYDKEKEGKVWIMTEKTDTNYNIIFSDIGKKYNPLEKEDPNINIPLKDREKGGLGIYLVKQIMDKVEYKYENFKNIFTISIKL